ncbi:DUF2569 domain-containing protein [Paenibacillus albidus]|uniref:DUF2569 domain-containing protein n=1 Tax=Paenibacillus albidus TaxID=2041023 RepID=UPI001BECEE62|nr:DUF2569 domain-containing protein [Paenibacillus albidus]MBT2291765.1 DUF2569 domain-containing protein [Paenibacillus albidus]
MGTMMPTNNGTEIRLNHPNGLGGWMVLVQIGLYLSVIRLLFLIFSTTIPSFQPDLWDVLTSPDSSVYDPLWKPALIFEAVVNVTFVLFSIFLLVQMYRKKATFPRWIIFYYVTNLIVLIIDYVLLANIELVQQMNEGGSMQDIGRLIISCAIWVPYFLRSKRVRNTFVN